MSIYFINTLNGRLGYVCADDHDQAITIATNMLGFSNKKEYVDTYPGCWENTSTLRDIVEADRKIFDFMDFKEKLDTSLIFHAEEVGGLMYVMDMTHSASHMDEDNHKEFQSKTMLVPKTNDLIKSDKVFNPNNTEDMWYCEDWKETEDV